jgi:hypothetical protein
MSHAVTHSNPFRRRAKRPYQNRIKTPSSGPVGDAN